MMQYLIPAVALIIVQIIISVKQQRVQDVKFEDAIESIKKDIENVKEDIENVNKNVNKDISRLEKKQDKHNNLIERMIKVEQSAKSAHHRIEEIIHKEK